MPHGGIALDPSHFNSSDAASLQQAWVLHAACLEAGREAGRLAPDLVLLSTPHGVADLTQFQFYLNSMGFGVADTDNCACPPCCYNVSVSMDKNRSTEIVHNLKEMHQNVSGLVGFSDANAFPLRWGEVIPLHFLTPSLPSHTHTIILSQPNRRYTDSVPMIPELLKLGSSLFALLEPLPQRVVVVISADLAHTHLASGPYGYSNASEPFDQAVGSWARSLDPTPLLVSAAELVDRALSCGYTGLVMLHGVLQAGSGLQTWSSKVLANFHPSYYGMMVASFSKQ